MPNLKNNKGKKYWQGIHDNKHKEVQSVIPRNKKGNMHQPGIEPGSVPWQGTILPLDHWCFVRKRRR